MNLLQPLTAPGYPADYLLARLQGRRPQPLVAPAAAEMDPWDAFRREQGWLYRQMDGALRRDFAPVLAFWELRTLLMALRLLAGQERERLTALLADSLLRQALQAPLHQEATVAAALERLGPLLPASQPLAPLLQAEGWGALERQLRHDWAQDALRGPVPPTVRAFLQQLIAWQNQRARELYRRWQLPNDAPLLPGSDDGRPVAAEVLLRRIGRNLTRAARYDGVAAQILDHLWRRFLQTRQATEEAA